MDNEISGGAEKTFKAMNEEGRCFSFSMHAGATMEDARRYASLWSSLAGEKARVKRVWEA